VTLLWHYENIVPPRDWSGLYADLVNRAKADGAWVTTAGEVAGWFRVLRETEIEYNVWENILTIRIHIPDTGGNPSVRVRVHIDPGRIKHINTAFDSGSGYIDIRGNVPVITVALA
jgi:hypothetical protein